MANLRPARPFIAEENTTHVDVETWTQRALDAMKSMSLHGDPSAPAMEGTAVALQIPLDDEAQKTGNGEGITAGQAVREGYVLRRKSSQRDSLRRRDALLKGKEGSRQRRRWENDRLIGNPHAEPPLPVDWEVGYSHPRLVVPYQLAPLWDARFAQESAARKARAEKKMRKTREAAGPVGSMPKDLKEKLKRARGAKGLLQDLESEVRSFVAKWEAQEQKRAAADGMLDLDSSEDEEIVFVGRQGQMHDMPSSPRHSDDSFEREKLVFDSLEEDQGASFGRWLVHSIGQYYGLETWSITTGHPARREAYVGIKEVKLKSGRRASMKGQLPQPLWAMV